MRVRVDEAWKDILAAGVDDFRAIGRRQVAADLCNRLALAENVRDVTLSFSDDFAIFDEQ